MLFRNTIPAGLMVLLFAVATALAESPDGVDLNSVLDHMEQAQAQARAQQPGYSVTRAYKFYSQDPQKPSSQVIARVDYQPPANQSFSIQQTSGSNEGPKIVKRVLEHETKCAYFPGASINRANYDFQYLRMDELNGRPAYVLQITPKQESRDRVKGQVWVDSKTYMVRRVEGELSKSPSWWIKSVHLVLSYGMLAGVWVQTTASAVADVRFFGSHTMLAQAIALQPAFALVHSGASVAPRSNANYARVAAHGGAMRP